MGGLVRLCRQLVLVVLAAFPMSEVLAQTEGEHHRGPLVIVGGGTRTPEILERFVSLAGGKEARIVVVPFASIDPHEAGRIQKLEFEQHGASSVHVLAETDAAQVLETATGVFMTGGDQSRLRDVLLHKELLEPLQRAHARGVLVGGSSAGAAVMGDLMITGNELATRERDSGFRQIRRGTVEVLSGFALWPGVVVDQHFTERRRHNRLLSVVLENPELVGVGIDEATAVVVDAQGNFEVLGWGGVSVYDARKAGGSSAKEPGDELSVRGLELHLLRAGERFTLAP